MVQNTDLRVVLLPLCLAVFRFFCSVDSTSLLFSSSSSLISNFETREFASSVSSFSPPVPLRPPSLRLLPDLCELLRRLLMLSNSSVRLSETPPSTGVSGRLWTWRIRRSLSRPSFRLSIVGFDPSSELTLLTRDGLARRLLRRNELRLCLILLCWAASKIPETSSSELPVHGVGDFLLVSRGELDGDILGNVLFFGNRPEVVMSSTMSSSSSSSSLPSDLLMAAAAMLGELREFKRRRERTGLPAIELRECGE